MRRESRWFAGRPGWGSRHLDRGPDRADAAGVHHHAAVNGMGVGHGVRYRHHGTGRNPDLHQPFGEGFAIFARQGLLQSRPKFHLVVQPVRVGGEAWILGDLGAPEFGAQAAELSIGPDRQEQLVPGGRKQVVGRDVGAAVAHHAWRVAGHEPVVRIGQQDRQRRVVQRHFEKLALARTVALLCCHQDADRRVESRHHVDDGNADPHGTCLRIAVDAEQPGPCLHGTVVAGHAAQRAVAAETGDACMDQPGETFLQYLGSDAPALHGADLEVLDHDVGALEHPHQDRATFLL